MREAALRIRSVAARLEHLSEVLDPRAFRNLLGAVEVEVETGEEAILEHRLRTPRPALSNVLPLAATPRGTRTP